MKGSTTYATLTNLIYVLIDVVETNVMNLEQEFKKHGFALRHETKRDFNTAIAAIRRLRRDVNQISAEAQDMFGDDADMMNAFILMLVDRCGDNDRLVYLFYKYIKAFPSRGLIDLSGTEDAFKHLDNKKGEKA